MAETTSQGTKLRIGSGKLDKTPLTDTFIDFCITSVSRSGSTTTQIDVTTLCDTGKKFISGFTDYGSATVNYNFAPGTEAQKLLAAHEANKIKANYQIVYPDDGLGNGEVTVDFEGTIESKSEDAGADDAIRGSLTIKISGQPTVTLPTPTTPA